MIPGTPVHLAHLDLSEVSFLSNLTSTFDLAEHGVDALWLRVVPGGRTWILETPEGRVTRHVLSAHPDDASPDPTLQRWLPIPERIMRVATTGASDPTDEASLTLVDGTTAVLTCPDTSGAVDLVAGAVPPVHHTWSEIAEVTLPTFRLAGLMWSAYAVPHAARGRVPRRPPPMWLRLDDTGVTLHVDWNDAQSGRSTYRSDAEFEGEAITVPIRPTLMNDFLHQVAFSSTEAMPAAPCTVHVGDVEIDDDTASRRRAVAIRHGDATLTIWVTDPLIERWGSDVERAISLADVELIGNEDTEWLLRSFGVDVRVTLHHGHPDHIRTSAVVCTGLIESVEVLHEINQLNSVSTGPRFVLADGTVHAVADLPCSDHVKIGPALAETIDQLVTATRRYAPLLGVLTAH